MSTDFDAETTQIMEWFQTAGIDPATGWYYDADVLLDRDHAEALAMNQLSDDMRYILTGKRPNA